MKLLLLAFLLFTSCTHARPAQAAGPAGYLRLWRGFQLTSISDSTFKSELPAFMRATNALYGNSLSNYLVALPPQSRPAFVPDEVALLAFGAESDYRRIRETPEGKAYGEKHWELFAKEKSRSVVVEHVYAVPAVLEADKGYDFGSGNTDWSKGHTTYFVGLKKAGTTNFLARLAKHIGLVREALSSYGMRGYVVVATGEYEMAVMNWDSEDAMKRAFASPDGQRVGRDGAEFLENFQWTGSQPFNGSSVEPGAFYSTM